MLAWQAFLEPANIRRIVQAVHAGVSEALPHFGKCVKPEHLHPEFDTDVHRAMVEQLDRVGRVRPASTELLVEMNLQAVRRAYQWVLTRESRMRDLMWVSVFGRDSARSIPGTIEESPASVVAEDHEDVLFLAARRTDVFGAPGESRDAAIREAMSGQRLRRQLRENFTKG